MGNGPPLTDIENRQMLAFVESSMSYRKIVRRLNRSARVVSNFRTIQLLVSKQRRSPALTADQQPKPAFSCAFNIEARPEMKSDFGIDPAFFSEKTFASHDAAIDALRVYCHSKGFAVKKKRDNKAQTKDSIATIYYFVCGRAGEYKNYREHLTEETRVRSTKTHLCGCSFKASVRALSTQWTIQFDYVLHNHEPTTDIKSLRNARRMSREQLDMIKTMNDAGASVKATLAALQSLDKSTLLIDRDIMNARQKLHADELQGRREMQALADELLSVNVKHLLKQDDKGHCTHLFIMPKISEQLTAEFHSLIQIDSTYRTNRYNMPLLHIVGHTNTNRTFTIAVCFMRSEKTGDYQWALEAFRELAGQQVQPEAIVTDRELALMNAIQLVFPRARHILCAWHIGKNILAKCKTLFPVLLEDAREQNLLTWEEFSLLWSNLVLKTLNREAFFEGWSSLKTQIQSEVRNYIEYQWLTPWKTRFCATFLQDVLHFGTLTTSRVEGCHAALKTWIPSATVSLFTVYKAVNKHCTRQNEICVTEREVQRQSVLLAVRNVDFFKDVHSIISHEGLKIVHSEYRKARAKPAEPCKRYLLNCFGLPCSHLIYDIVSPGQGSTSTARLRFDHFNAFWLLDKTKTSPVPTSAVLSPTRIQNPRGRTRGKKRVPSEFEIVEAPKSLRKCGLCKMPANHNRSTCPTRSSSDT